MPLIAERPVPEARHVPSRVPSRVPVDPRSRISVRAYPMAVIGGLLLLGAVGELGYAIAATVLALCVFAAVATHAPSRHRLIHHTTDRADMLMIAVTFVTVVALYRVAFQVIEGSDMLLFLFFALGMLAGVAGPVVYTVWGRRRTLATLGLSASNLPRVAVLALVFAGVQFAVTFWGYSGLPGAKDVITLGTMALVVGVFESIFFRGFIQGRLQESFGVAPAVFGSAVLYGAYHVGYGMGLEEILFLTGLGIIYALAYATVENLLVMWPLLTPMGSLYAQFEGGDLVGRLPWAALMGWADVAGLMIALFVIAHRRERKFIQANRPDSLKSWPEKEKEPLLTA